MSPPPAPGWGASPEPGIDRTRHAADLVPARRLLRRLVEVVAQPISPQQRLDQIVRMIAANLVAEVCSVYAQRAGDVLELFATEGLAREAVHKVRMRVGEGLVGTIAAQGLVINTNDAQVHPNFRYFPETHEEIYHSFVGVPILRSGQVVGVLTVQNRASRVYDEDEVEAMQIIASVLAEMFISGGIIDRSKYGDLPGLVAGQKRIEGMRLVEGVALGRAWLHEPRIEVTRLLADDPVAERARLDQAITSLRESLDTMLASSDLQAGEHRDVLEAYRMLANDGGWRRRIREAIDTGLSAEAAVRRVQDETRVRIGHASDPYLRERLLDLDDLANRLLMHLAGRDSSHDAAALPDDVILVARNLSATELIEFDRRKLKGVILEEGSRTAHVTIVARALDIPLVGRIEGAMAQLESGDPIALDGDNGQVFLRPGDDTQQVFVRTVQLRQERRRQLAALKDVPAASRDGIQVSLQINAGFLVELAELQATGADGVGLYRTELAFMARNRWPSVEEQADLYGRVLDQANGKRVVFRTLDIGSDKHLPYWRIPLEENPALGWRAMRISLDYPTTLRGQLRALSLAASGRHLAVMFPMVAEVQELLRARRILDAELRRLAAAGEAPPTKVEVGVMFEVPSLFWQLGSLLPLTDFISVGTNDLVQYLFACDRGNPAVSERHDVLAPAVLAMLRELVLRCRESGVPLAVCGEMASRPLEAMALVALGLRQLSLTPSAIGLVKEMLRSLDVTRLTAYVDRLKNSPEASVRTSLLAWARDNGVMLPPSVYRPY